MERSYDVEGEPAADRERRPTVQYRSITPEYLEVLGIPLLRGRAFTANDRAGAPPVALINEAMVKRHWPEGNPLGRRLLFDDGAREIVGVVADSREFGPEGEVPALAYFPQYQEGDRAMTLMVRSTADPAQLLPALRAEVWAVDPNLPVFDIRTMREILREQNGGDMIMTKLLGFFAVAALFLAIMGVYGVMAYSVTQRTQEMGIRMAIGAQRRDVLRLVVRQGSVLAGLGIFIGLGLALAVTRTLSAFLNGVSAFDIGTFIGVTLTLTVAALAACVVPGMRATRVDPLIALRSE